MPKKPSSKKPPKKIPPPTLAPKKAAKKKHEAMMPVRPSRGKIKDTPGMIARRARIQVVRDRTKAAKLEIDELAAGADLQDLVGIPVVRQTGRRRAVTTSWRNPSEHDEAAVAEPERELPRKQSDIYLIESKRTCSSCGLQDHPGISCKELEAWLEYSSKVLSGEIAEIDPEVRRLAEERARAPKKRGRRRKYPTERERFDAMTPDEQAAYLIERDARRKAGEKNVRTATAASPSPAPNPST